jgi:hypothetical protein
MPKRLENDRKEEVFEFKSLIILKSTVDEANGCLDLMRSDSDQQVAKPGRELNQIPANEVQLDISYLGLNKSTTLCTQFE